MIRQISRKVSFRALSTAVAKQKVDNTTAVPLLSSDLAFRYAKDVVAPFQVYSLLSQEGVIRESNSPFPNLSPEEWRRVYKHMVRLNVMDDVFLASQRQV